MEEIFHEYRKALTTFTISGIMMKGFAATPIIFIAVFLITAMLFIHFMDIDKQVAEGVGKEARLRKLQAAVLKNQTAGANELFFCGLFGAQRASNEITLEKNISLCVNRTGVDVHKISNAFTLDYKFDYKSNLLIDSKLEREVVVSERVNYPFFELTEAADKYNYSAGYYPSCSDLEKDVYNYLNDTFPTISWGHKYTECFEQSGYNLTAMYLTNWINGSLSEKYPHNTDQYGGVCNCK